MDTKSKSKATHGLSILALVIGMLSLMYCYTFIQQIIEQGFFHTNETVVQLTRMIKGGA